ncbi:MAG: cation diffusion facilitator family transporter, partial [Cyanobacteriota bacterium]
MSHNHSHGEHGHDHRGGNYNRAFAISIALNIGFVIIEAVYGILANSLALLADAGHNLSDVLGLLLAWGATILVRRRPTARRTYGLRRSSILAALLNAILLLVASGAITWEAIQRFSEPSSVSG